MSYLKISSIAFSLKIKEINGLVVLELRSLHKLTYFFVSVKVFFFCAAEATDYESQIVWGHLSSKLCDEPFVIVVTLETFVSVIPTMKCLLPKT